MAYDPGLGALEHTQPNGRRAGGGDVDPTLAVVVARLDDLREDMKALRAEVRSSTANVVGRGELASRRAPWWSVVAAIGSVVAVAAVLIPALAR